MSRRRRRRRGGRGGAPFSLFSFQDIMAAVTGVMIVTTLLLVIDLLTRTAATVAAAKPASTEGPSIDAQRDALDRQAALLALLEAEASAEVISPEQVAALERERVALEERIESLERAGLTSQSEALRVQRERERARIQAEALAEELAETQRRIAAARQRPPVTLLAGESSGKATWWVRLGGQGVTAGELRGPGEMAGGFAVHTWPTLDAFVRDAAAASPSERAWVLLVEADGVDAFTGAQEVLRRKGFDVGWDLAPPQFDAAAEDLP